MAQTCCDFEIILVDDGSTDASGKICDEYALRHAERIRVIHKTNQGNLAARLDAIRLAQGNFCIFVDSDDFVEPTLLEEVSGVFRNAPDTDVVLYSFRYHRNGKSAERFHPIAENGRVWIGNEKRELYEKLLFTNDVSPIWVKAIKTSLLKSDPTDYSVYHGKNMAEDVLQSLYILTAAQKVFYLNRPLYNYRIVANSVSHTFSAESISRKCCLHVYEKELEYLKIWGMDTSEYRGRVATAWFERAMYEFIHFYENASSAKERKAVVDANWDCLIPTRSKDTLPANAEPIYVALYHYIRKRRYFALRLFFLKRSFYRKWKSVKKVFTRRLKIE